jgi:hypothetical protein
VIEEAHEVVDAIDEGSPAALREELGDLLMQIVFQSELAHAQGWFGLFGPAKLPPNVVAALNKATTDALRDPEVIARFEKLGVRPDPQTPGAFATYLAAESTKWGNVAKSIKLD